MTSRGSETAQGQERPAGRAGADAPSRRGATSEEQLVRDGLPLLRHEARRLWLRLGRKVELEELVGMGQAALVDLVRRYDGRRSTLGAYATERLRWALLDGVRRDTHGRAAAGRARALAASARLGRATAREPASDEAPPSEQEHRQRLRELLDGHAAALAFGLVAGGGDAEPAADSCADPEQLSERLASARTLRRAVTELVDGRQRALIERHYFGEERFDDIASDLGISKSRASRLHAEAIGRLAGTLRQAGVAE
ncbi:MAG: sigma-70 family RNA polymerase sigma factor [Deltaproteobacteria bacterium]|nr:sigma-70 family RNA polymerase sigma factor [Deltaproteobacteria bacterium]